MCVHTSQLFPNLSSINLEIIILAKRSYDPINQKHADEAKPACLVFVNPGRAHKHFFDWDARPTTNFNYPKK